MIALLLGLASAGYGDAEAGIPLYGEREVHLWTNAVRADSSFFKNEYDCNYDFFTDTEKAPQQLLWWHGGLAEISRLHSMDMDTTGLFSHSSSDGTSAGARIEPYYGNGLVGENIAEGYPTAWDVMIEGWMCSSGHRENILYPSYTDLGVGEFNRYWTQDFGGRGGDSSLFSARLGLHFPAFPGAEVEYLLAVHTGTTPPDAVEVVLNGAHHAMELYIGTESNGIYRAEVPVDGEDCGAYWFEVRKASGTVDSYPQDGAYGFGSCPWGDSEARWLLRTAIPALQAGPAVLEEDPGGCGCSHGAPATGWLAVFGILAFRRRSGRAQGPS